MTDTTTTFSDRTEEERAAAIKERSGALEAGGRAKTSAIDWQLADKISGMSREQAVARFNALVKLYFEEQS